MIARRFREVPRPTLRPAFAGLLTDPEGNLRVAEWISDFAPPDRAPTQWFVFAPDGRLLGAVGMPSGFRPREIGRDYVLGVARNEFGVERIELHRLVKS